MGNFVSLTNALQLREFLNMQSAKELRETNLEHPNGEYLKGFHIRVETLTDGSEVTDYIFE